MYDCHTHTQFSHDSVCPPSKSLEAAIFKGLDGFALTDHCDIEYCLRQDIKTPILQSVAAAHALDEQSSLTVLKGIEIGEALWHPSHAEEMLHSANFDIIIDSVHAVRYPNFTIPFAQIDFSSFSEDEIDAYLKTYFEDLYETVDTLDFDVLAHLACPLRYICGKFSRSVNLEKYADSVAAILRRVIDKHIALEVNTSCLGTPYSRLLPEDGILKKYKQLGGQLITLGSDAHIPENFAHEFQTAAAVLRQIGFTQAYYYKNRTPVSYSLEGK